MRSLNALVWRNLTAHRLRSLLTTLAIALGVAMVLAAAIVGQAASQQAAELAAEGAQVDLEISARDGGTFDQSVLEAVRASPDVEWAAPSLRIETQGLRPLIPRLVVVGVDPETYGVLHRPRLADGLFLGKADTIVLPMSLAQSQGLGLGDEMDVWATEQAGGTAAGQVLSLTVAGRLEAESAAEALAADSGTAFVPLEVAQVLAGASQQIDHVDVSLHPHADVQHAQSGLAQALKNPGFDLVVGRAVTSEGVMGNVVLVQGGLAIVGLIILFAAGFVILNAFAMSVTGRMRELGTLRALGMTRGGGRSGVMRLVLAEAAVLGLAGTAAGTLSGLGLAWAVMRVMGTLADAPLAVPLWGLAVSALMGLGVTLVAALQPAWRASRVSPIVATRPEATAAATWYVRSGGRAGAVLLGLVLLGMGAYGFLGRPDAWSAQAVMMLGQGVMMAATVLLLPGLVGPLAALCRQLLTRWLRLAGRQRGNWEVAGRLAIDSLGRNKLRTALTAGALTAGLTIIVATSGLMTAGLKGGVLHIRSSAHEDAFIAGDLAGFVASRQLTVDNFLQFITSDDLGYDLKPVVEALDPLVESGLAEVIRYRFQAIPSELSVIPGAPGLFADPEVYLRVGNFEFFEGDAKSALAWMQRGQAVLLMPIAAERLGVEVGDEIPVQTPRGEVPFTVAGIGGGGFMMPVFPYADGEAYFDVARPSFLGLVVPEQPTAVEAVLAQVQERILPFPGVKLHDFQGSIDPVVDMIGQLELLLDGLLLLAVVVAALGVVNTTVINVAERQREIGLLRAVGATQQQVRRAFVAEAVMMGLLAALVADLLGLLMLLSWGLLVLPHGVASVGVRPDWETIQLTVGAGLLDWGRAAAASLVLGPLVAGLAAYLPARQAAARPVVEATRSEQGALKRRGVGARRQPGTQQADSP